LKKADATKRDFEAPSGDYLDDTYAGIDFDASAINTAKAPPSRLR
jgi:hypothetical protein